MKTARSYLLLLALVLPLFIATPLRADSDDPPGRVARLSYLQGTASLQPSGESQWSEASLNYTVTTGDRLYTDQGSRAELEVSLTQCACPKPPTSPSQT